MINNKHGIITRKRKFKKDPTDKYKKAYRGKNTCILVKVFSSSKLLISQIKKKEFPVFVNCYLAKQFKNIITFTHR